MTVEELAEEFKNAEICVDHLLSYWKNMKFTRENIFISVRDGTASEPDGITMTALCVAVMAERLMKEIKDETQMDNRPTAGLGPDGADPV